MRTVESESIGREDEHAGATRPGRFSGMGRFGVVWIGHLVTLIGNAVLRFAFVVHAWTVGARAVDVAMLTVCAALPQIALSPVAGAVVDRCRKKFALRIADASGLVTVGLLAMLYFSHQLVLWEIYLAVVCLGAADAFAYPALSCAVPLLVSRDQLQRANGLLGAASSAADVLGPALAAVLLRVSGLGYVIWLDLATFVVALGSIAAMPAAPEPDRGRTDGSRTSLAADAVEGVRYLGRRPGLRRLVSVFFFANLSMVLGFTVLQPMILARTGDDSGSLAAVMSCMGIGGVAGGLLLAAWGGPKRQVRGMMLGIVGMCLSALIGMALVRASVPGWCVGMFVGALLMPVVNGTMQAVVQTDVPQELQGRVFGALLFTSQISAPIAMLASGVLADHVFDPEAASGGGLVRLLRPLIGAGAGTGMAAMLLLAGVLGTLTALAGLRIRADL